MDPLLVFQTFRDKEQALRTALENHDIFVAIEETQVLQDSNFIGQQFSNPFILKIPSDQFAKADEVLMTATVIDLDEVDKDYMLLSFSDEELIDVMKHKKDWGIYNYKLAEKLLQQRKVPVPLEDIVTVHKQLLQEEAQPEAYDAFWIAFGYIMAGFSGLCWLTDRGFILFTFPALLGIVVGIRLFLSNKTLADGRRVLAYKHASRIHGLLIAALAPDGADPHS